MAGRKDANSWGLAPEVRNAVAGIERRLEQLDAELERFAQLRDERDRLQDARAALLDEVPPKPRRISQDEIAAYLAEHPGSRGKQIAEAFDVPLATIATHLYRGKQTRFISGPDGWRLRDRG